MPRMALLFRQFLFGLTILPLTIHAANTDYDGAWDVVANCGVNASNGRPGFSSRLEWNIKHGKIQEVQVHRNASPREQTTWDGAVREGRVELVGVGTREPSDKWTWRLSGSAINNRLIKLSGFTMHTSTFRLIYFTIRGGTGCWMESIGLPSFP